MINKLITLADMLDIQGLNKEADIIDGLIKSAQSKPQETKEQREKRQKWLTWLGLSPTLTLEQCKIQCPPALQKKREDYAQQVEIQLLRAGYELEVEANQGALSVSGGACSRVLIQFIKDRFGKTLFNLGFRQIICYGSDYSGHGNYPTLTADLTENN